MKNWCMQVAIVGLVVIPSAATAQEYFGRFLDTVRGVFNIQAKPRPTFRLESDFRFDDPNGLLWVTPAHTEVDGASIPQFFWSFIGGPFEGEYINASVIHDHYCRTKTRMAHDTHRNFYYGMRAAGVERWKAEFMYWAVSTFGPDWKLQPRITLSYVCSTAPDGKVSCATHPKLETSLVVTPAADLSDPEVLALALSKATAVARTLRTTDGKVLDISPTGQPILATVENVQSSGAEYRAVFEKKDFYSSPAKLGILASVESGSRLSALQPWEGNQLPKPSETWVLTPRTTAALDVEKPFKVDNRSKGLVANRVSLDALEMDMKLGTPR